MKRWQFSIRSLLVLTAVVSLILAFAVKLPDAFRAALLAAVPVLLLVAIFQAANFATSERRPAVSLVSWTLFGGFFAFYSLTYASWSSVLLGVMTTCALLCFYRACCALIRLRRVRASAAMQDDNREPVQAPAAKSTTKPD